MKMFFRVCMITLTLLGLWESIVFIFQLPDYILPSPTQVFLTLYHQWHLIAIHTLPTTIETILGLFFGVLFGCLTGYLVVRYRALGWWFLPLLIISQAIPTFAIAPLLVIWFGYGISSKIATAILMIFFPVASAFHDGLRETNHQWINLAKTMNAKKHLIFWKIQLPAALPSLASGIRIAAVAAPIGALIGEWVGSSQGLGYLMLTANARMQIDMMFAALIVIILLALMLYFSVDQLLRKLIWWSS